MREIKITYTNLNTDDMILEIADYIRKGFSVYSVSVDHSFHQRDVTVELHEKYKG